ncbi:MAG: hypothetical protein AAF483_07875 [Planctomycetota bacterium]
MPKRKKPSGHQPSSKPQQRQSLKRLEKDFEKALAKVVEQYPELPIGPDQPTMHFLAKAAVAAYEAALEQLEA